MEDVTVASDDGILKCVRLPDTGPIRRDGPQQVLTKTAGVLQEIIRPKRRRPRYRGCAAEYGWVRPYQKKRDPRGPQGSPDHWRELARRAREEAPEAADVFLLEAARLSGGLKP